MATQAGDLFDRADSWARVFRLLGDSTRLRLLSLMHYRGEQAATVTELARQTGLRVATASAALRAMENAGVVTGGRDGREVRYRLTSREVHAVLHHVGFPHASDAG